VRLLIFKGADVNMIDSQGNSLVHIAAINGYLDVLKILVEYSVDLEVTDANGCKPIYAAAIHNQLDVLKYLVQIGVDLGSYSYILMNTAVRNNDVVLVSLLVSRGIDINTIDESGRTALHYAAQCEKLDVMKYLVAKGADMYIVATDGCTPLGHAILYRQYHSVVLLCSLGVDIGDNLNFFQNNVDEIFVHRSLAENLSAALNVYKSFSKHKGGLTDNLLNVIFGLLENFGKEWNYERIKIWLQDKSLGDLTEVIRETHNLIDSYSKIKNKLRKSKNEDLQKVKSELQKINLKNLVSLLEKDQFELIKNAMTSSYVKEKVPSLERLESIKSIKAANFIPEELLSLSNLKITDIIKLAEPVKSDMVCRNNYDSEIMQILHTVEMDDLSHELGCDLGKVLDVYSSTDFIETSQIG